LGQGPSRLLGYTGLRQAEQFNLKWENVDFTTGIITVRRSKHGENRHVPMNRTVRDILDDAGIHDLVAYVRSRCTK
jgi:integrase